MAKLQTFAQSPHGAIEELRRCLHQYMRLFGDGLVITAHRIRAFLFAIATTAFCQPDLSRS